MLFAIVSSTPTVSMTGWLDPTTTTTADFTSTATLNSTKPASHQPQMRRNCDLANHKFDEIIMSDPHTPFPPTLHTFTLTPSYLTRSYATPSYSTLSHSTPSYAAPSYSILFLLSPLPLYLVTLYSITLYPITLNLITHYPNSLIPLPSHFITLYLSVSHPVTQSQAPLTLIPVAFTPLSVLEGLRTRDNFRSGSCVPSALHKPRSISACTEISFACYPMRRRHYTLDGLVSAWY